MSRVLKRVALDFEWPLNEVWKGYLNPYFKYYHRCRSCENGYSPQGQRYYQEWYGNVPYGQKQFDPVEYGSELLTPQTPAVLKFATRNISRDTDFYQERYGYTREEAIEAEGQRLCNMWNEQWNHHLSDEDVKALVEADRLFEFCRRPINDEQAKKLADEGGHWLKEWNGYMPTREEVNEWNILSMGHDSINCSVCIEARCKRNNEPYLCDECEGHARIWESDEYELAYDEWEEEEPPKGDGYQLWETVSEGSPISPVFDCPEKLADWLERNDRDGLNYKQWLAFIKGPGWAPSMIGTGEGIKTGAEAMADDELERRQYMTGEFRSIDDP